MNRITRPTQLTPEQAAKNKAIREQVAAEVPELVSRHHERMAAVDQLSQLVAALKAAREAKGLSLAALTDLTGLDGASLSTLEANTRPGPTVETLARYAEAVGKRLVVLLADA